MTCRACGATIADKAIVCYRCGAATADLASVPRTGPSAAGRKRNRVWGAVAGAVGLAGGAVVLAGGWTHEPWAWVAVAAAAVTAGLWIRSRS